MVMVGCVECYIVILLLLLFKTKTIRCVHGVLRMNEENLMETENKKVCNKGKMYKNVSQMSLLWCIWQDNVRITMLVRHSMLVGLKRFLYHQPTGLGTFFGIPML